MKWILLGAILTGACGFAGEPQKGAEKTGVFEWFLQTWIDVKTDPKKPKEVARVQLKKCLVCHAADNKWGVPYVPFDRETELKKWLASEHLFHGEKILGRELMLKLLWEEQHMPRTAIQYYERKALKEYLDRLASGGKK